MYIEQLKKLRPSLILYLPIPLGFIGMMIWNYIISLDVDTAEMMNQMIAMLGVNMTFVIMLAPLVIGLFVVLLWTKFIQNISITMLTTSRSKIDWQRIFFSFFLWTAITTFLVLVAYFLNPENFELNFKPTQFFVFLALAILLIPLQTSFEEYLFRAHMMQGIGLATNSRLIPLVITSVLFGLMHAANPEVGKVGWLIMIYYIGTGFFLGIITLMDEGLELALGFHAANNLVGALLVTADWTAFQTHSIFKDISEPSAGFEIILPIFVIFPLLLFFFSKKYKWNNWKQKLTGKLIETEIENDTSLH
ncbi:lysostaphin resistance A-like protein [Flavobacterium sp.]|uniref:CPBP family intramembrane glutamic endopeptidase n=1 Tax=Flavobacterium sp. TaxID=239 RepID=UPI0035280A7C